MVTYIVFLAGVSVTLLMVMFFENYTLQSPIILRSPVKSRFISPIGKIKATEMVRRDTIEDFTVSPTPTIAPRPTVMPKKAPVKRSLVPVAYASDSQPTSQEIADYIKSKSWPYETALRVAKSENFWNQTHSFNCGRTHVNNNGSIDRGIFQINSVHDKQISPEDALDCYKNIDYAYNMWKVQGWNPWYAYKNGSYLTHDLSI